MSNRLRITRHRYRRWLRVEERRGVLVLVWSSVVCLTGVSVTGVWQFFRHESDSAWFVYEPGGGSRLPSSPSEGMAELHGIFAAATAVVALVGGAWLVYKVLFAVPWAAVVALALTVFGLISGSVIRFNVVQLSGRTFEDAARGYPQVFGRDLEFVVTSRLELGPTAIRLWTAAHVLTVPILLAVIWLGLPRREDPAAG